MMDDPDCDPVMLSRALREIALLNRYLGAHSIYKHKFLPLLKSSPDRLTILDVGTGIGDIPVRIIQWSSRKDRPIPFVTATDLRNDVIQTARYYANNELSNELAGYLNFEVADLTELPYGNNSFDYVIGGQVLHHFTSEQIPVILREMKRVARRGLFIEDLHRHPIAYHSIRILSRIFRMSQMVQHDGPLSVNSGFKRRDLEDVLRSAGISNANLEWHPTFRWSISNVTS